MKERPLIVSEEDDRFYVSESTATGAGKGLFAKIPLPVGESLQVIGVLLRAHSDNDLCTHYADAYKFRVGEYLLIPLGYGGMVNHSHTPNMNKVIEGQDVWLRALRPIEKGEELFFSYSEYAQETLGLS